jgi:potassium-transporting ATPase ATP-binding subunit
MESSTLRKQMPVTALLDPKIVAPAIGAAFAKLDPRTLAKNPVIFVLEIVTVLTTVILLRDLVTGGPNLGFTFQIVLWLWFTVLFANFAEAIAEGRGKAQADSLRRQRTETQAKVLRSANAKDYLLVPGTSLKVGDIVLVEAGDIIPSDGDVIEGVASVNEAAITGESAPVIREAGGDRSAVTGGTQVLSDWIRVRVTAAPGSTFLDRMIRLVEGAERQKTPNEIALNILLAGLTIVFVFATATIPSYVSYAGGVASVIILVALFVTLIPTTIGGLLSAIGIAGMDRLVRFNVLAMSGRAVEAAGDVDTLLLDKTGTITLGNRQATEFRPLRSVSEQELADAAQLASLADETPEGRSIVVLAKEKYRIRGRDMSELNARFIPFSAQTRMSGVEFEGTSIRKGAVDSILAHLNTSGVPARTRHPGSRAEGEAIRVLGDEGATLTRSRIGATLAPGSHRSVRDDGWMADAAREVQAIAEEIAKSGGTPLAVCRDGKLLGVIHLKDIVKGGIRERFAELRRMGIRTIMITGDNPTTAAAIAAEAGVDDFLAQATPEDKLKLIRDEQAKGKLVAMCGDGTNDAPALAQADVGVAMNTGTQAAREAGNMVDLDSNPTKLIEVVEIGKQLLMTRGALTTFSIANDAAKYFAIIPAMFLAFYPQLQALNIMNLTSPQSAILSAIIFNALIIIALIPLALKGVAFRPIGAGPLLRRNLLIYGLGGIIIPFIGIKAIDLVVTALNLV